MQLLLRAAVMPKQSSVPVVCRFYPRMGGETSSTPLPTRGQPHPAPSLSCCHPGVLLSWEGARRSQIPGQLQETIQLSMGHGPELIERHLQVGLCPGGHDPGIAGNLGMLFLCIY